MKISTFPLGPLQTNGYLLRQNGKAVAIDPGGNPKPLLDALGDTPLEHILLTHLHFDHTYGVRALERATEAPILASRDDLYLMDTELGRGGMMGLPVVREFEFVPLDEGETTFLDQPCSVLHTPGHTKGSLSFYFPQAGAVFVGDLLFYRSVGRTDFPGGDPDVLIASVRDKIFTLPPETVVYSGHGQSTTVGDEINHNPFFSEF